MNKNSFILRLSLTVLFLISKIVFSQEEIQVYNWYDNSLYYGKIGLYNGVEEDTEYRVIDGNHKFYESSNYVKGNLIYENQLYFNVQMKYDLYNDKLIVRLKRNEKKISLKLLTSKVKSFEIHNKKFIKLSYQDIPDFFVELLYHNEDLRVFKRYKKNRKEYSDKKILYNRFFISNEYFISYKKNHIKVISKSYLKKIFPKKVKNINAYYRDRKNLRKINYDSFLIQLFKYLKSSSKTNK